MSPNFQVIIAGAGIGGLACGLALRRAGHSVTVLEKSSLHHEIGQGITCSPNGVRILDRLGLDVSSQLPLSDYMGTRIVRADTLEVLAANDYSNYGDRFGYRMKTAYRPDFHAALVHLATRKDGEGEPVRIRTKTGVVDWNAEAESVTLDDGTVFTADLIIAADGVKSHAARHILEPDLPCPSIDSTTTIVYRFTLPTAKVKSDPETSHLLDAGNGICSFNVARPAMDRWLVRYYCRDNQICNFALYVLESPSSTAEKEHELRYKTDRNALIKAMQGFHPSLLKIASMADDVLPLWRCTTREPLPRLHRGRMVVIGDAAHPVLPHHGMGALTAIEDSAVLGVVLANLPDHGDKTVTERLALFSQLRVPRVAAAKLYSDTPFFRDAVAEQNEAVKKWYHGDDLPEKSEDLRPWYMTTDVVKEAEARLAESRSLSR